MPDSKHPILYSVRWCHARPWGKDSGLTTQLDAVHPETLKYVYRNLTL